MRAEKHLHQRDSKKLALSNNARLKRVVRRKLENKGDAPVTEEMVSSALAQRNFDQVDQLSRTMNNQSQYNNRAIAPHKSNASTLSQLPTKALKRNVLWLSLPQQSADVKVSLTTELNCFAEYVQVSLHQLIFLKARIESSHPICTPDIAG